MRQIVGASDELIRHHVSQHPCRDDHNYEADCPCGNCRVLVCGYCEEPIFLVILGEWCEHAEELAE